MAEHIPPQQADLPLIPDILDKADWVGLVMAVQTGSLLVVAAVQMVSVWE